MAPYSPLQIRQSLKMVGFSDNEIKVLLYLFQKKKATPKEISHQTTVSFSMTQYALSNLSRKELVKCLPSKKEAEECYELCSEEDFFNWLDEQKAKHEGIYDKAKKDVHNLMSMMQENSWQPSVLYYEGKEGIIEIYEDMLENAQKEIYSWLDIPRLKDVLGDYLQKYIKKRVEKDITSYDIVPENEINKAYAQKNEKRKVKFIKKEKLPIDGEIRIYGDKVAVITFHEKKPVGFVFQGEVVTALFKAIFKSSWES